MISENLWRSARALPFAIGAGLIGLAIGIAPAAAEFPINGSFENGSGMPSDWVFDSKLSGKGTVRISGNVVRTGRMALELVPNSNNTPGPEPLAIGQLVAADQFRGQILKVSAWIGAQGGATAVIGVAALGPSGASGMVQLRESGGGGGLRYHEVVFDAPIGADAQSVIVFAAVEGTSGRAYFDDIVVASNTQASAAPAATGGQCVPGDTRPACAGFRINTRGWNDSPYCAPYMVEASQAFAMAGVAMPSQFASDDLVELLVHMYTPDNFWPTFEGGQPEEFVGPTRAGQHNSSNSPWNRSDLYLSVRRPGGGWYGPYNLSFNDDEGDCCGMLVAGPHLNQFSMIYQKGVDLFAAYFENGSWSRPIPMEINTGGFESNPHFEKSTMTLYYGHNPNQEANFDLYEARITVNGNRWRFSNPRAVPGSINTSASEDQAFIYNGQLCFSRGGEAANLCAAQQGGGWSRGQVMELCPGAGNYCAEMSTLPNGDWCMGGGVIAEQRLKVLVAPLEGGRRVARPID